MQQTNSETTLHTSPTWLGKPVRVGNVPPDEPEEVMVVIPMDTYHDLLMRSKTSSGWVMSVVAGMAFVAGVMLSFLLCAR